MFLWVSENFYKMDVRWKPFEENGKVAGAKRFLILVRQESGPSAKKEG